MKIHLNIDDLPGYPYPTNFIKLASIEPETDIEPWWLLVYNEGTINNWYKTLKQLYPERTLIPFAKFNANDDIACFDGDDFSGQPHVLIIHAYASEGWELHATYASFDKWLEEAMVQNAEWFNED